MDRYTKTRKTTYTSFELFSVHKRDIPMEVAPQAFCLSLASMPALPGLHAVQSLIDQQLPLLCKGCWPNMHPPNHWPQCQGYWTQPW